jgi:hypothetical protein
MTSFLFILGLPICQIWLSADYTASTASILNLLTLSLDRYWSITSPLEYLGKRTKSRALFMIGMVWSTSFLWIIPITLWPYIANGGVRIIPSDTCNTEYNHNLEFKLITAVFNFYLPLIAMILINTKIYIVIRRRYRNPVIQYTIGTSTNFTSSNTLKKQGKRSDASITYLEMQKLHSNKNQGNLPINKNKGKLYIEHVKQGLWIFPLGNTATWLFETRLCSTVPSNFENT